MAQASIIISTLIYSTLQAVPSLLIKNLTDVSNPPIDTQMTGIIEFVISHKAPTITEPFYYTSTRYSPFRTYVFNYQGSLIASQQPPNRIRTVSVKDSLIMFTSNFENLGQYLYNLQYDSNSNTMNISLNATVTMTIRGDISFSVVNTSYVVSCGNGDIMKIDVNLGTYSQLVNYGSSTSVYGLFQLDSANLLIGTENLAIPLIRGDDFSPVKNMTTSLNDIFAYNINNLNQNDVFY